MQDRYYIYIRGKRILHETAVREWRCRCGARLTTLMRLDEEAQKLVVETVCSYNGEHPVDGFVSQATYDYGQAKLGVYEQTYQERRKDRMGFVKDRHDQEGHLLDEPSIRRAGKIGLGEKLEGGGAVALPYFVIKPFEEEEVAGAVLAQVRAALEQFAPGQNMDEPTVLPVYLPADSLPLIASSIYKLAGKEGRPRCVGNGDVIQFKLGPRNLLEIHDGEVSVLQLTVDREIYSRGEVVPCPGRNPRDRWEHCEKCRFTFNIDLQIAGLPYIWMLSTGDQAFYTQFFTVWELLQSQVQQGNARFVTEIPLLLRRVEGTKARPQVTESGVELRWTDMPLLNIEIHPLWLAQKTMQRTVALGEGKPILAIPAPKEEKKPPTPTVKPWYERAKDGIQEERPWSPMAVMDFVNKGLVEYRREFPDAVDKGADGTAWEKLIAKILDKQGWEELDIKNAILGLHWWFWANEYMTIGRMAAMWHWANRPEDKGTKILWHIIPEFEQELIAVLDEINRAKKMVEETDTQDVPPELEKMGAVPVQYEGPPNEPEQKPLL